MQPQAAIREPATSGDAGNPFEAPTLDFGERSAAEVEKDFMLLSVPSMLLVFLSIGAFVWACVFPRVGGFYQSCAAAALGFSFVTHGLVRFAHWRRARRSALFFRAIGLTICAALWHAMVAYTPTAAVGLVLLCLLAELYCSFIATVAWLCLAAPRRDRPRVSPIA